MDVQLVGWLSEVLGPSFRRVRSLNVGITSELEVLEADDNLFVLRCYADSHLIERHPTLIADEVKALEAAHVVLGDLVPRPIAFDQAGTLTGQPVLLMTYLRGEPVIHDLDPVLLVEPLVQLHSAQSVVDLAPFHHWFDPEQFQIPDWSSSPQAWSQLIDLVSTPEPRSPVTFLHRDYHPGNLLWEGGQMTGIVDWAFACHGPTGVDVAHTRCNLMMVDGSEAAERFLLAYEMKDPSYEHHPWWDAAELLTWDDEFSGLMAFNTFGAGLDVELLRSRADTFAEAISRSAGDAT
jgi:aminoglycoside phosphotransferase (APT) family kinase protein